MQLVHHCLAAPLLFAASTVHAADAEAGRRIAETRCVSCHVVVASQGREISAAPPFEVIARKFATSPDTLAYSLRDPHPKMNVTLTRREMEDVAAYINTLAK